MCTFLLFIKGKCDLLAPSKEHAVLYNEFLQRSDILLYHDSVIRYVRFASSFDQRSIQKEKNVLVLLMATT